MAAREGTVLGRACRHARGHGRRRAVPRNESRRRVLHGTRRERKRRAQSGTCTPHLSEAPPLRHGAARVSPFGWLLLLSLLLHVPLAHVLHATRPTRLATTICCSFALHARSGQPRGRTRSPLLPGCSRRYRASWQRGRRSAVAVASYRLPALIKGRRDVCTPRNRLPACRFNRHSLPGLASQPAAAHRLLLLAVLASL